MGTFSKGKQFPRNTSWMSLWNNSRLYAAQNCLAEGLLLQPPRLLILPKNNSIWSWLSLNVHKKVMPNRLDEIKK